MKLKTTISNLKYLFTIVLVILFKFAITQPSPGDLNGPPDLPGDTTGDTPMGGSAPIDGGTLILLSLALLYLLYKNRKALQKALSSLI